MTLLFLGRIHPIKGIDLLLKAWARVAPSSQAAELLIAGSGAPGYLRTLREATERLGLENVLFSGPVYGRKKLDLLSEASVVVLPSLSENYGMVVAEALASGTPVITTTGTPWQELLESGCGWWVPPTVEAFAAALAEALAAPGALLREMGRRGRRLIEEHHSVERAAEMMEAAYEWLLGRRSRPEFVRVAGSANGKP